MAPLSSVKERARALKERVFSKRNTRTIQLDESGSPSTAPAFKEAVRTRDSNIAAGPNAAVPKEEQPPNSTVAGNSRIAATVDKQLSHSASAKRSGLSSDIVVSQVDTPTPGGHSIDRVIPATLASVTCPDGSDQVQPISTDIGGHPSQKEELLRPVEPVFESPYMKLAIQSLEDKKGYEHLTKYIDQLGCEGAEQIISQFEKDVSQKLGPEALHGTSVLGMKVQRLLPVLGYAKPLVTSIAKLDPHHIAPWVCAGVFFALETGLGYLNPETLSTILDIHSECSIILYRWKQHEQQEIMQNCSLLVAHERDEIRTKLPTLYVTLIKLVVSMFEFVESSKWKQAGKILAQDDVAWKARLKTAKRIEAECESRRSGAERILKFKDGNDKILDWISQFRSEDEHSRIQSELKLDDEYTSQCQWLFLEPQFRSWEDSIGKNNEENSVLWIKGTMGTGKTTLMCSAISWLSNKYAPGRRVLRYYCSSRAGAATETKYVDVIRSLIRELALKVESHDFKIAAAVRDAYNKKRGEVQTKEWEELFRTLLQENPSTIIAIDALNECETSEATKLLNLIRELASELPVHIIVSSLEDLDINSYLHRQGVLTISMSPEKSNDDMDYFITCEIATAEDVYQNPLVKNSIFYKDKELSLRLKKLLLDQACGMFQWAKIWISLFYPPKPIRFSEEAIRLLENLENLGDEALTKVDYLNDAYWRRYNKNAQNEADRKYMIRAYRIILCSYRPLSLSELAEAVSIRSDSTLDPDIIDDDEFLNLKSLCHNFLKFPKSPEGEESFVEFVHDSARLFILTMRASANVTGKAEDFSDVNNHLEMTKMCLAVMRNSNHAIWRRARPHISPTDWVQRWERLEQDHDWSKQDWDLFRKRAANTLMMCNEDHFAVYICLYWLQHCQELARLQGDTTPLSSDLIQALFQDESAFRGWVFYVIMVDPASERSRRRGHLHGLKWRVESILKLVKEGRFFQPSPLFVITKWDLFRHLSSSQDYEAAFRRNYQASAKRSSTRGNPTFTPPWKIDDSLVAGIFQDQYSRNVFGQIALHTAADHLFPGAIWPLFLGKRDANLEEQLKFLLLPDHSKMNALHLAASFGSTAWEQGRALATLREILRVEAVLNEYGSPLPAEQPRRRLATSRDSRGRIPMEILANTISSWAYIRGYRCTPEVLDIVCEMLHDVEPSFDEGVCMALLDLRGYLSETNQAKKLWDAVASKKQGTIAEVMAKLYPKLLQEGPHGLDRSMWEARMTGIVDFNPETIRSEDAFGNTSLMKYLLDPEPSLKKKHVRFLANAHGKHFGWKGYSTYHFQYLKSTCSSPDILHSLKALGADLSLRDSNGDALLHFFGHNTAEPRDGEEQTYSRHNIYTCPYLDSAEDLRVLLLGNGRLFDCDSQGITAFSDILEKIQCHIGYVAFVLLCKCGLDNKFWLGDLWIGRYRKFNGTTLLDYLSLIIAAYQQRDPAGGSRTIEISLNNALLESFPAEDVTLEEVMKYGHEIGILRQKWETLMGIENEKWVPDALPIKVPPKAMEEHVKCLVRRGPLPRNGRYKKGPWEDQLAWAHDFLSEDEIEKMEARLRNAEGYGVDYWERIKIRKGGEEGSRTGRRGEDSPTSPLR